jgi:hypothetical protein
VAEQIKVRYSYRLEDLEDVHDAADRAVPTARRTRREAVVAGCLFLIAPFLAAKSILHPEAFLLGMSPFGVCFIWWGLQNPKRDVRKRYAQAVEIFPEYEVTIEEGGITTQSPTIRTELKWEAMSQILEGKGAVGLVCENVMYVFPGRAFNQEEWDRFLGQVRERIPGTGRTSAS